MKHVSRVHSHSSGFSMTCGIQGCLRSYTNYTSWSRHVQKIHNAESSIPNELQSEVDDDFAEMDIDAILTEERDLTSTTELQSQKEKARWISYLRDENKLIQSCTENILSNIIDLCSHLLNDIKQTIGKQLQECEVSSDTKDKVLRSLDNSDFKQPFKGLETKYQQISFFKQHLGYVVCFQL